MKTYDYSKAKKLIEENKENLSEALLGMHEDWYWTAETIWEDGKYIKNIPDNYTEKLEEYNKKRECGEDVFQTIEAFENVLIGGIGGSSWATPTLCLRFNDRPTKMIPCYTGESDEQRSNSFSLGCLSEPVQQNITPLEEE